MKATRPALSLTGVAILPNFHALPGTGTVSPAPKRADPGLPASRRFFRLPPLLAVANREELIIADRRRLHGGEEPAWSARDFSACDRDGVRADLAAPDGGRAGGDLAVAVGYHVSETVSLPLKLRRLACTRRPCLGWRLPLRLHS